MTKLYIKSIARRWKMEISSTTQCSYILSPYITSRTAESVLSHVSGKVCEIYTLFSAELFCSKASSLKTIKKLAALGHKIFHLPNLHAKIVLVPGAFASIGSQNLTHAGTKNKEASIALRNTTAISQVERKIMPWFSERIQITADMISEMEELLVDLEPLYEEALMAAAKADRKVFEAQTARDADFEQQAKEVEARRQAILEEEFRKSKEAERRWLAEVVVEQQRRELDAERELQEKAQERLRQVQQAEFQQRRLADLQSNISGAAKSLSTARGVVRVVRSGDHWNSSSIKSLVAQDNRDLTYWSIDGAPYNFVRGKRYLVVLEDSGKVGWARLMQTRMSFVGIGVNWSEGIFVNGFKLSVSINGDWANSTQYGRNIIFKIEGIGGRSSCIVSGWFDLKKLEILKVEHLAKLGMLLSEQDKLLATINGNVAAFSSAALTRITTPFVYKNNLYGADAEDFFGPVGSCFTLRAALIGKNPIIVAKRSH